MGKGPRRERGPLARTAPDFGSDACFQQGPGLGHLVPGGARRDHRALVADPDPEWRVVYPALETRERVGLPGDAGREPAQPVGEPHLRLLARAEGADLGRGEGVGGVVQATQAGPRQTDLGHLEKICCDALEDGKIIAAIVLNGGTTAGTTIDPVAEGVNLAARLQKKYDLEQFNSQLWFEVKRS